MNDAEERREIHRLVRFSLWITAIVAIVLSLATLTLMFMVATRILH